MYSATKHEATQLSSDLNQQEAKRQVEKEEFVLFQICNLFNLHLPTSGV